MKRDRTLSRWTVWVFAGLLLAKGAVPFFASAAAQLHGKGVAEICPMVGVALPAAKAVDPHAAHRHHATQGNATPALHDDGAANGGDDGPQRHDPRAGEHCVLSALATFAAETGALASASPSGDDAALVAVEARELLPVADAAARWASLLGHGPPHRS